MPAGYILFYRVSWLNSRVCVRSLTWNCPPPPSSDRANLRDSVARVLPEWGDDMEAYGRVVGMLAFGHEEMGCLGVAEECARQALRHDAYDPWAGTHPTWLGCRSRRPPCSRFGG